MTSAIIKDLGCIAYSHAWKLQKEIQQELIKFTGKEHIFFCEHFPVITYGSSSKLDDVLIADRNKLEMLDIELIKTDRGGDITYHGPGQLVCYLLLDLRKRKQDINWYLRSLESIVINTLKNFNIQSHTIESKTGVWLNDKDKICSIGVRLSRWCTMHGISINYSKDSLTGFQHIRACGIKDARAVSMECANGIKPDRETLIRVLKDNITAFYQLSVI